MKKRKGLLLVVGMFFVLMLVGFASAADLSISTCAELRTICTSANYNGNHQITDDVTCTGKWGPICANESGEDLYFRGTLDGNGHTVSGIDIDLTNNMYYVGGLIGVLEGGTVQDIILDLVQIKGLTAVGGGTRYVGGLVGFMNESGSILRVGVIGGDVDAGDNNIGGLVGEQEDGSITASFSTVDVKGSWSSHGGLVGLQSGGTIVNSFAIGEVEGDNEVGGFVGRSSGTITNCFARGDVNSFVVGGEARTGGFVGRMSAGLIRNSYATGQVFIGAGSTLYGGFEGRHDAGTLTNNYRVFHSTLGDNFAGTQHGMGRLLKPGHDVYVGTPAWNLGVWEFRNPSFNYPLLAWSDYEVNKPHITIASCSLLSSEFFCDLDNEYLQIVLGSNINCEGTTINRQCDSASFEGIFDGKDYMISNFEIDAGLATYVGLISQVNRASIGNLILGIDEIIGGENVGGLVGYFTGGGRINNVQIQTHDKGEITGSSSKVGGLVGSANNAYISNCFVNLTKVRGESATISEVGGLIGRNKLSPITNCSVNVTSVEGVGDMVGGLVGRNGELGTAADNGGKILDSYVIAPEGRISGYNYVGGLVGYNYDNSMGTNYALVNRTIAYINVSGNYYIGGLVGLSNDAVRWSNFSGNVKGINHVGGIAGKADDDVEYCNSLGDFVEGGTYVGGLVGSANEDIEKSISFVDVSGTSSVGGAVGVANDNLFNVFAFGDVSATQDIVGGLIGESNDKIVNCSANGDVSGRDYVGGLVGVPNADINKSVAFGDVSGRDYVGGFFGWQDSGGDGAIIENSYSKGDIVCNSKCGGFGSVQRSKISNCYSRGEMQGIELGGFVYDSQISQIRNCFTVSNIIGEGRGFYYLNSGGSIVNSYYTGTPGHPVLAGEPTKEDNKDDFKYKTHNVYYTTNPKWNFISPWGMIEGETYPYLVYLGVCGDTICSFDENCQTCPSDCGCSVGFPYCSDGECVECTSSSQCPDGQVCEDNQCIVLQVGEIKWQNMMKGDISNADIGDSVLVFYENGSGSDYFEVKEGPTLFTELREVFEIGLHLLVKFILVQEDLEGSGPWSLNASSIGGIEKGSAGLLITSTTYDNSVPSARLESPLPGKNYTIGSSGKTGEIDFENIISDEDDDLEVNWNYGDGNTENIQNCLTSENCNDTYRYQSSGTKTVILRTSEIEPVRNQRVINCSRVFAYAEGYNTFPIIDDPFCGNLLTGIGYHDIDGSSSHVKYCDFDESDCNTHRSSQGIGDTCKEIADNLGGDSIWCYISNSSSDLRFRWTFDGVIDSEHIDNVGFKHFFNTAHDHTINLKVFIEVP